MASSILKPRSSGDVISPWDTLPRIEGEPIQRISDIRTAPSGDKWELREETHTDSELLIKVHAVATDRFTLYLEEEPFEKDHLYFRGGIQLDSSGRKENSALNMYIVRFQLPSVRQNYIRLVPLVPALECRLSARSQLPSTSLVSVEKCSKRIDPFSSYISFGWVKDEKLHFEVEYPFSIVEFRLEYENKIITDIYGKTILKTELHAIEDHKTSGCACERKGTVASTIEFDLSQLGIKKIDRILLTDRMIVNTQVNSQELYPK